MLYEYVRGLASSLERALSLLEEVCWAKSGACRFCYVHRADGHAEDCRLASLLKAAGL